MRSIAIRVSACLSVCPSACPLAHLKNHTPEFHQIFCTCYLVYRRFVLVWRPCHMLCNGKNRRRRVRFVELARRCYRGRRLPSLTAPYWLTDFTYLLTYFLFIYLFIYIWFSNAHVISALFNQLHLFLSPHCFTSLIGRQNRLRPVSSVSFHGDEWTLANTDKTRNLPVCFRLNVPCALCVASSDRSPSYLLKSSNLNVTADNNTSLQIWQFFYRIAVSWNPSKRCKLRSCFTNVQTNQKACISISPTVEIKKNVALTSCWNWRAGKDSDLPLKSSSCYGGTRQEKQWSSLQTVVRNTAYNREAAEKLFLVSASKKHNALV